jgi:hypothetical protein
MGCLSSAGDGDASPGAVSYIGHCGSSSGNKPEPQNRQIRAGIFAGPFLPTTRLALPEAICKDRGIDGRGSRLSSAIKLRYLLNCQGKNFGSSNGWNTGRGARHNIHKTEVV